MDILIALLGFGAIIAAMLYYEKQHHHAPYKHELYWQTLDEWRAKHRKECAQCRAEHSSHDRPTL